MATISPIVLRKAIPADAEALARMRWNFNGEDTENTTSPQEFAALAEAFSEFLQGAVTSGRWTIWVAEINGQPVAHIYVQVVDKIPRPGRFGAKWGYITNVYVEPEARNRGIGTKLLRHVIHWARSERLQMLILWPSDRSIAFYQRAGFQPSAEALELHLNDQRTPDTVTESAMRL